VLAGGKPVNYPPGPAISEPEAGHARWAGDRLISIRDIREIFRLGRTAAYELTHRPEFPGPVRVSPRCYRWWASEVNAFADSLRCERAAPSASGSTRRAAKQFTPHPAAPPRRITGKVRVARSRKEAS
jgi:predicted DNA-binding transcriptional regulator AlpA